MKMSNLFTKGIKIRWIPCCRWKMSLRKRKKSHGKKRAEDELMEPDDLKVAKTYTIYYGGKDDECLV